MEPKIGAVHYYLKGPMVAKPGFELPELVGSSQALRGAISENVGVVL